MSCSALPLPPSLGWAPLEERFPHLGGRAGEGAVLASAWLLDGLVLPRDFLRPRRSFVSGFLLFKLWNVRMFAVVIGSLFHL